MLYYVAAMYNKYAYEDIILWETVQENRDMEIQKWYSVLKKINIYRYLFYNNCFQNF